MNFLAKNFLRGLVITVPIALTLYVLYSSFIGIDRLLPFEIPGLGFLITITAVILIGFLGSSLVGRSLIDLTERVFRRAPIVKIVYSAIKDLIEAFVGDQKRFKTPVVVEFPSLGAHAIGFVTRDDVGFLGLDGFVSVYFPQSYNIAGNLLLVPADRVRPVALESAQLMTFIVSGGVSALQNPPR